MPCYILLFSYLTTSYDLMDANLVMCLRKLHQRSHITTIVDVHFSTVLFYHELGSFQQLRFKFMTTAISLNWKSFLRLFQVQLDSVLVNFQSLHHFFFLLCKIFKEGFSTPAHPVGTSSDEMSLKFASQGGFLQQTTLNCLQVNDRKQFFKIEKKLWESFSSELAEVAWAPVKKCLHKGMTFMDFRISQVRNRFQWFLQPHFIY